MAKKKTKVKDWPRLTKVTFRCPTLRRQVTVEAPPSYEWSANVQDCDMCGSHGKVTVMVNCKCKDKRHQIELHSW